MRGCAGDCGLISVVGDVAWQFYIAFWCRSLLRRAASQYDGKRTATADDNGYNRVIVLKLQEGFVTGFEECQGFGALCMLAHGFEHDLLNQ